MAGDQEAEVVGSPGWAYWVFAQSSEVRTMQHHREELFFRLGALSASSACCQHWCDYVVSPAQSVSRSHPGGPVCAFSMPVARLGQASSTAQALVQSVGRVDGAAHSQCAWQLDPWVHGVAACLYSALRVVRIRHSRYRLWTESALLAGWRTAALVGRRHSCCSLVL
jgi:hypothetical protein